VDNVEDVPIDDHYALTYLISETKEDRSEPVRAALQRIVNSRDRAAGTWARALLYRLYKDEHQLDILLESGCLRNSENEGCLDALLPIVYEAMEGNQKAQQAVQMLCDDPKVDEMLKEIIRRNSSS